MEREITNNLRMRVEALRKDISETAKRCGRDPSQIRLMAVTKGVGSELILAASQIGIEIFGENYVQEAVKKLTFVFENSNLNRKNFHFIGHLQKNKINKVIDYFGSIDSVDSFELAESISNAACKKNLNIDLMIEVKTSNEPTKFGLSNEEAVSLAEKIRELPYVNLTGLMTMAPLCASEEIIRESFRSLYKTYNRIKNLYNLELPYISMGMSDDYKIAIEEGSTMLRLGRAIFGRI